MLTASERQTLADELTNDPDSLGYTDAGGNLKSNAEGLEDLRAAKDL